MKRLLIEIIIFLVLAVYVWWDCQPVFAHNGWEAAEVSFAGTSVCWALWKVWSWPYLNKTYKVDYLPLVLLCAWIVMEMAGFVKFIF